MCIIMLIKSDLRYTITHDVMAMSAQDRDIKDGDLHDPAHWLKVEDLFIH